MPPLSLLDRLGCIAAVFGFLYAALWAGDKLISSILRYVLATM